LTAAGGSTLANFPDLRRQPAAERAGGPFDRRSHGATAHQIRETVNAPGNVSSVLQPWWLAGIPITYDTYAVGDRDAHGRGDRERR
jgi:hypothetical protein